MARKYFGTDGIRGRANQYPITPDIALKVGMAAGLVFRNGDHRHRVVIGKDTRLSGYMIENALVAGFTSVGIDVLVTGPIPTPGDRHADPLDALRPRRDDLRLAQSLSTTTASSCSGRTATSSPTRDEAEIETLIDADLGKRLAGSDGSRPRRAHRRRPPSAISSSPSARCRARSRSTACASSSTAPTAPPTRSRREALWELGAEVIAIGVEPNGLNINHEVGSTAPAALAAKVREMRADIGIALDGDADRVVDHRREGPPRRRRPADGGDRPAPGPRKAASPSPASSSPSCPISASSAISPASASASCARRSATATSPRPCASRATISAASSPATSSCPTTPPPATGWSPRSSSSPSSRSSAAR